MAKKTQNFPTSCKIDRLNPNDQLSRLCAYAIYKRILRGPTKESALVLIIGDIRDKNAQEWDHIRSEQPLQHILRPI